MKTSGEGASFRSGGKPSDPDFRTLFESAPGLYLVVEPDAPRYTVVAASDPYLRATMRKREEILGRGLFEVWPPNPAEPESTGVDNTAASLDRVIRNRAPDTMAVQRHDVRRPEQEGGAPEKRFWSPVNSPVFGRDGELLYILHRVEDVTESVRLTNASRDAVTMEEQRFRELFDRAPDGIFVASPDGRYIDVNPAGCRLLGYTREELMGRSIVEFVLPGELPRQAALTRRIQGGGAELSEWRLRHRNGTSVPVELASSARLNGEQLAFVRDITERIEAEERLKLSERMFAGIVSISADAIVAIDEAQRITIFNEGAESMFGYASTEVLGSPLETLIPERFRPVHRQHVETFAKGQETARRMRTRTAQIRALRKDGEEFPADATISKLELRDKRMLIVAMRDISEETRIRDEERLLAELGKVLVEAGADSAQLLTAVPHLLVRDFADWCSIDVVEEGDVRRLKLVHRDPAKAATCEALVRRRVHQRRNIVSEVLVTQHPLLVSNVTPEYLASVAQDAEQLELLRALDPRSFIIVPLVARGQSLGALSLGSSRASRALGAQDLALVERLAGRIALAVDNARLHKALERAIQARDEVLAIVAHDLRNPLNSIVLQSQLMRRRGDEAERRDLNPPLRIHRAAMRMNRLIQDLLDVTRLEAGENLSIDRDTLPTAAVLAEAIERQEGALSERTLNIDATTEPADVSADRSRLLQIFDNLVGNAMKFSRKRVTVGAAPKDGDVLFWVADDGPGIPAENLPHLFDRFWQANRSDRRGVGLGLWIVKEIITAHGGRIWVESEMGVGTTVYFTLPAAPRGAA